MRVCSRGPSGDAPPQPPLCQEHGSCQEPSPDDPRCGHRWAARLVTRRNQLCERVQGVHHGYEGARLGLVPAWRLGLASAPAEARFLGRGSEHSMTLQTHTALVSHTGSAPPHSHSPVTTIASHGLPNPCCVKRSRALPQCASCSPRCRLHAAVLRVPSRQRTRGFRFKADFLDPNNSPCHA